MFVSSKKLDALLNASFPIFDNEAIMVQTYTLNGVFPSQTVASVTGVVTVGAGVGGLGTSGFGGTNTIIAVNDANDSLSVQIANLDGTVLGMFTEYVVGFTANAILVSSVNSNAAAFTINSEVGVINSTLGILSDTPITPGQTVTFTAGGTSTAPSGRHAPSDFNGDGYSDLLLENDNGGLMIYSQANLAFTQHFYLGLLPQTWHAVAVADFNADGQPDILMQNISGAIVDYLMDGTTIAAGHYLGNPGPYWWQVRGAADFNHDGDADILLQNDDGTMVIWTTNGVSVTAGISIGNPGPGWTVQGVADFNGDGQPDILVQNSNGALVDYLMNGTTILSGNDLGNPGPGWAVAGTGDYNGDGRADIPLHNDDGTDVVWNTNGTAVTSGVLIGNPGPSYTGAVAGLDLNGDGASDLVVQNADGTLIGYTLNAGGAVTAGGNLGAPAASWHVIGNNPMEFIDGTRDNTNLVATPGPDQFDLMSQSHSGLWQITDFDPARDSLALSASLFASYADVQKNEYSYQGGTLIELVPPNITSAVLIQGVTPGQLSAVNFVFR